MWGPTLPGDVYYAMSRWEYVPGFAACNSDERQMSGLSRGIVMACDVQAHMQEGQKSTVAFVGLFGGERCAGYSVRAVPITDPNATCVASAMGRVTGCL